MSKHVELQKVPVAARHWYSTWDQFKTIDNALYVDTL